MPYSTATAPLPRAVSYIAPRTSCKIETNEQQVLRDAHDLQGEEGARQAREVWEVAMSTGVQLAVPSVPCAERAVRMRVAVPVSEFGGGQPR